MDKTQTEETPNKRLKEAIDALDGSISEICAKTRIPKRTLYGLFNDGATIKSDYLIALYEEYGVDPTEILVGSAKNSISARIERPSKIYPDDPNVAEFERRIDEIAHTIEYGPFSQGLKFRLIESLLRIVREERDELQKQSDPNLSADDQS